VTRESRRKVSTPVENSGKLDVSVEDLAIARAAAAWLCRNTLAGWPFDELLAMANLALVQVLPEWRPGTCIRRDTWLMNILRYRVLDKVRETERCGRKGPRPQFCRILDYYEPQEDDATFVEKRAAISIATSPNQDALVMGRELREAVERLPRRLARLVHMRYFEQMLLTEIAACMGVTPGRVSQMETRAIALLRGALGAPQVQTSSLHLQGRKCEAIHGPVMVPKPGLGFALKQAA